jgi:hypothetical protein
LGRNCLLKQVIEGKIEGRIKVKRRQERRGKQLLDDLKEKSLYYKLKEEALDLTQRRNRFGRLLVENIHKVKQENYMHLLCDISPHC